MATTRKAVAGMVTLLLVLGSVTAGEAVPGHRLDWYRWADVTTSPYMLNLRNLHDGDLATSGRPCGGPEIGATIDFAFPEARQVTVFRFMQTWLLAKHYAVWADASGKGKYDVLIKKVEDEKSIKDEWITIPVNKKVHGLRFMALSGNTSYRQGYPVIKELEIYTAQKVTMTPLPKPADGASLTLGEAAPFPAFTKKKIQFNVCADTWHVGLTPDGKNLPEDFETFKGFQSFLTKLKEVDADGVRFFLETACCRNLMPWKSKLCPNNGTDMFKNLIAALHKHGYKSYIFLHAWIEPLQRKGKQAPMPWRRWDYPYEQSDRLIYREDVKQYYKEVYPCVICQDDFYNKWLGIMKEAVGCGVDGVYVMPDEYYFKGHNLEKVKCPYCTREFKKRFGYDSLPARAQDTEPYRKWEVFEYEKIASVFDRVAAGLKKTKPDLELVSSANPASPLFSNLRMEHGIALDVIGRSDNFTAVQLYANVPLDLGRHTALARRMRAYYPHAKLLGSLQWLGIKNGDPKTEGIKLYGYLLPFAMNGARIFDNYRLNYMSDNKGWWQNAQKASKMLRLLEQWDLAKSHTPASTCVLLSRASEDWWQTKMDGLLGGGKIDSERSNVLYMEKELPLIATANDDEQKRLLNCERFRGMYAGKCMEGLLIENGIQYDVHSLERPETLTDLAHYKLLILPFAYALSEKAFAAIKKAVESGTTLLIYDQLAPVDEWGRPHAKPLLGELIKRTNVVYVKTNLASLGMMRRVRQDNSKRIHDLLGDTGYGFENDHASVEYLVRKVDAKNFILYLANWERTQDANPVVRLLLPAGDYMLTAMSSQSDSPQHLLVNGKETATAESLKRFHMKLAPGEVWGVHIRPAPNK